MNNNKKIIAFAFIVSLLTILICSCNSPLYPFNIWVDENAFMTVGKSWLHGLVPYRDIFEQKGPFLYFIFLIANLISQKTFIGVFILEVFSFTISLFWTFKIIQLYTKKKHSYYILPLFAAVICYSPFFSYGGSAEEFCLPFFIYGLYTLLKLLKEKTLTKNEYFINGLCASFVFLIKFNLVGFWIGFFISQLFISIKEKNTQDLIKKNMMLGLGFLIPLLTFSVYFYLNNSFKAFVNTYFLFNSNSYSHKMTFITRVIIDFKLFYKNLTSKWIIMTLMYVGTILFLLENKYIKLWNEKILLIFTYIMSFFGIYYGGFSYSYYFLFMMPYIIFGLIYLYDKVKFENNRILRFIFFILLSIFLISRSDNIPFMKIKKKNLVQFKYAEIMKKNKAKTLLNYGFLDSGFYMSADILPSVRYFELQNAPVDGMNEVLGQMIDNRKFDYIVVIQTNDDYDPTIREIHEKYNLVRKDRQKFDGMSITYHLYKAKGL